MRKATNKSASKKSKSRKTKSTTSKTGRTTTPKADFPWWEHDWWVAWVFLTLAHESWNGSTYDAVAIDRKFVGMADLINEAIPMVQEVEDGVNRLASLGLLHADRSALALTETGQQLFEKILKQRRSIRNQFEPATRYLMKCKPLEAAPARWHLSETEYKAALQDYHDYTAEILKKLR